MTFRCGHVKYGPNVRVKKDGRTVCRTCERQHNRQVKLREIQEQREALRLIQVSR